MFTPSKEIQMADVEWKVITNTPCKPATAKKNIGNGKWYYTTERFEYEPIQKKMAVQQDVSKRDAEGNRIELKPIYRFRRQCPESCGNPATTKGSRNRINVRR